MFFGKKKSVPTVDPVAPGGAPLPPPTASPSGAQPPATTSAPAPTSAPTAAAGVKHPLQALGEVVSLMIGSPQVQRMPIGDLSRVVLPAIRANQIAVAEARDERGNVRPVAAVLWARVSAAVDQRLMANPQVPPQLAPEEWTSGSIAWVVLAVGSDKACEATIAQISKSQFGGGPLKVTTGGDGGVLVVRQMAHVPSSKPPVP
ncbi:MAG: toxin-activating lysine-acyltransferase [Hyphomicrobiaceae bacterium]|nr:toxin-activating lysine-acyltransferase [Hyphomicrobiaceae bacterium]